MSDYRLVLEGEEGAWSWVLSFGTATRRSDQTYPTQEAARHAAWEFMLSQMRTGQ
jgi:hypothetical protein